MTIKFDNSSFLVFFEIADFYVFEIYSIFVERNCGVGEHLSYFWFLNTLKFVIFFNVLY